MTNKFHLSIFEIQPVGTAEIENIHNKPHKLLHSQKYVKLYTHSAVSCLEYLK